jgi:protein arginine kinase
MICEEDHLRIQSILPGLALEEAYQNAARVEKRLDEEFDFAYSERLGYLTHCPTNLGTGMRASVMMFLPALTRGGYMNSLASQLSKIGLTVRGLFGEGSGSAGNMYQISNQITLGESEENIIEQLSAVIRQLVEYERRARRALIEKDRFAILDHVGRAFGLLHNSYKLSVPEAVEALSAVRFGVDLGMFQHLKITTVNELFLELNPGHLQLRSSLALPESEQAVLRAKLFREKLRERA